MSNKFETLAIRQRIARTENKEHSVPLYITSSFTFDTAQEGADLFTGEQEGNIYSRFDNPNTTDFANKLALLEGCEKGLSTATGMAAVYMSFVPFLEQGDHIVAAGAIFGNTRTIISNILPKSGVEYTFCEVDDNASWEQAIQPNTKILYVETPSNPTLKTADLEFLGKLCKAHNIMFVVDNCFATPYLQQPAQFGADLVVHSATKFIDGQGRVMGGAICGKGQYVDVCYDFLKRTGASLSPFNAWVLSKSLETLSIRMERHCQNALALAEFLKTQKDVAQVIYPGLEDYPQFALSQKQMKMGGGLVGMEIKGGLQRGQRFLDALEMHSLTANLGDVRSIATHSASTTHSKLTPEEQLAVGITPGFTRFSVGLEHIDDIIKDIEQALWKSK